MKTESKNTKAIPTYDLGVFADSQAYEVKLFDVNRNYQVVYPHRHHDFFEILYITAGTGTHIIDGVSCEVVPHSIFFLSPGQIHDLKLSPEVTGYIFLFSSGFYHFNKSDPNKLYELPFFYNILSNKTAIYLSENVKHQWFIACFENCITESHTKNADTDSLIRAQLELLLIQCKRNFVENNLIAKPAQSVILVKRFKQLVDQQCTENLSINEYAHQLNISSNHLSETVKLVTGKNSKTIIDNRMLLEMKRLLAQKNMTVAEVAYELNFKDASYFTKYFKKLTGQSPAAWRNQ